jgi:hypothetical protein
MDRPDGCLLLIKSQFISGELSVGDIDINAARVCAAVNDTESLSHRVMKHLSRSRRPLAAA